MRSIRHSSAVCKQENRSVGTSIEGFPVARGVTVNPCNSGNSSTAEGRISSDASSDHQAVAPPVHQIAAIIGYCRSIRRVRRQTLTTTYPRLNRRTTILHILQAPRRRRAKASCAKPTGAPMRRLQGSDNANTNGGVPLPGKPGKAEASREIAGGKVLIIRNKRKQWPVGAENRGRRTLP